MKTPLADLEPVQALGLLLRFLDLIHARAGRPGARERDELRDGVRRALEHSLDGPGQVTALNGASVAFECLALCAVAAAARG